MASRCVRTPCLRTTRANHVQATATRSQDGNQRRNEDSPRGNIWMRSRASLGSRPRGRTAPLRRVACTSPTTKPRHLAEIRCRRYRYGVAHRLGVFFGDKIRCRTPPGSFLQIRCRTPPGSFLRGSTAQDLPGSRPRGLSMLVRYFLLGNSPRRKTTRDSSEVPLTRTFRVHAALPRGKSRDAVRPRKKRAWSHAVERTRNNSVEGWVRFSTRTSRLVLKPA